MKLIDAEQLEKELTEKSSGYNGRAKVILWEYLNILHKQKTKNFFGLFSWLLICWTCLILGFLAGRSSVWITQ